jgi:hypothetical protein
LSNRLARFTQAEMTRALKAVEQSGVPAAIEVTENGLRVVPLSEVPKRKPVARTKEIVL